MKPPMRRLVEDDKFSPIMRSGHGIIAVVDFQVALLTNPKA